MRSAPPNDSAGPVAGILRDVDSASEPTPVLERLTGLAARALQAAAAVLVLAEGEGKTLRVRSACGLAPALAESGASFFVQAWQEPAALLIPDARQDARLSESPLVQGCTQFRAAAAIPVPCPDGGPPPGVLCVFDTREREFTPADAAALADLAVLLARELRPGGSGVLRETDFEARVRERTAELADAEGRYRSIFENAVEGIYQSLPGGGFLKVNPALARLLGYASPSAMLAALPDPSRLYVQPGRRTDFEARIRADGELASWESEAFKADGARLWIAESARAIRDADGNVLRYEGTFEDISARKAAEENLQRARDELEDRVRERTAELALLNGTLRQHIIERENAQASARRSESKFRSLVENAQDLISMLTPDGISLYQSPSIEHLLGYPPEILIGVSLFQEFLHPDDRPAVERASQAITEHGEHYVRFEMRLRHLDGTWRLLESIGSATPADYPVIGLVVNSRDITERRRAELAHAARAREQTAVAELGRHALAGRDLAEVLDRTAELVAHALEVPFCTVNELQPGGEKLLVRAGVGWREDVVGHAEVDNWRTKLPAEVEEPFIVGDLSDSAHVGTHPAPAAGAAEPRSAISVVIHCHGERFGTLCVLSPEPERFGRQDAVFLQTVADLLSAVIASARHESASREVQARYERIAANTPGMVYQAIRHADGTATVVFISEGCRQLYGLEPGQLRAQPNLMNDLIHPEDRARVRALAAASNAALTTLQWEGRLVHPSGEVRWVTVRSRPERLPNGDIYRDGLVLDVTELKRAQEEMRAAKEEAEKANRAKSEFLSRISHELRTPLNAILGFGQLLDLEPLTTRQRSSVEQILRGGRHLLDLINEVLDITRMEAGGMELSAEPVDTGSLLAEALEFIRPLAEQHRVRFAEPLPADCPPVLADRSRLHQILLNLLSNAVKYNRDGGEVRVTCGRTGETTVRLSVADTGTGLTPGELEQLFTPFERLHAAERGIEGTGIGLTISRGLVEAMGGVISVASEPGVGSTFHVDLPAAPPGAEIPSRVVTENSLPPAPLEPSVRTILLIDDQNANVSLVERVLEARGSLRLFTAADGRGGLALARKQTPDLILLDLHLPDMGGDEVLRRLRLEARTRDVPVVMLSADATPSQIARLRQLGARDYLTKPFRIRELLTAIDTTLAATSGGSPAAASTPGAAT